MQYTIPTTNLVEIQHSLYNQGSGTPVIPLNPECEGGTNCQNTNTFIGTFCQTFQNSVGYDVHYFIPDLDCGSLQASPCVVKVAGNVLNCTEEAACVDGVSCNNLPGSIIRCSGTIPNAQTCNNLDATVECTSPSDSDSCTGAP